MSKAEHIHPVFLVVRVVLGVGFLAVGGEKFFRLNDFIDVVASYRLPYIDYPYDEWLAYWVASLEVVLGLSLIFRVLYRSALIMMAGLIFAFVGGLIHLKLNYPEVKDCGCFPWESSNFTLHFVLLGFILLVLLMLWQEQVAAGRHRFKGSKLKLPG